MRFDEILSLIPEMEIILNFSIYFTAAFEESIGNGDAARQILNKLLEQYPLLIGKFFKKFHLFKMILEYVKEINFENMLL